MCGRYVVAYDPETLVSGFSVVRVPAFPRRWNVAPQSMVPVVHETKEGERIATLMRWGLLPHWAKDVKLANKLNNARAEGVFDKPSFRQAARRRRCLLPASGFYEWQAGPSGKQPWYISPKADRPFAMAGLFEAWRADESTGLAADLLRDHDDAERADGADPRPHAGDAGRGRLGRLARPRPPGPRRPAAAARTLRPDDDAGLARVARRQPRQCRG